MKTGIDPVRLKTPDTGERKTYVQTLIRECQQRSRDIAPDVGTVIEAYQKESEEEIKNNLFTLALFSPASDEVRKLCWSERSSKNEHIRERSAWYLMRYYPESAMDLYQERAEDPNWKVRFWIANKVVDHDLQAGLELFLSVWANPSVMPDWKEGIENDVALLGNEETIPHLRRLAKCAGGDSLLNVIWRIERRLAVEYLEPQTRPSDRYSVNSIPCEQCNRTLTVDSRYMGAKARCKDCGAEFKVPHW